jgi:multidrug resistance protein MdtO
MAADRAIPAPAATGLADLPHQVLADLAPFPGRFDRTWRIAAMCALMTLVAMLREIPEAAISCYLLIFLVKPDAVSNIVIALAVIVLATVAVAMLLVLVNLSIEWPPAQLAVMVGASLTLLWLGSASKLGEGGGIAALVITFIMTLIARVPLGEIATRGLLYAWAMAAAPMSILLVFNLFAGRAPQQLLRQRLADRLTFAATALAGQPGAAEAELTAGQADPQQWAKLTKAVHLVPNRESGWLATAVDNSYRLLLAATALPAGADPALRDRLAADCRAAAAAIAAGQRPQPPAPLPPGADPALCEVHAALIDLAGEARPLPLPGSGFFAADAFTNPVHQQYAVKTTAAAMICYLIYTALDWQGIHTALVTCYVAALGTAGETVHKLVLRITGALVGAAMGIFSLIFIVPQLDGIAGLMVLVFLAILPAAWVSSGPARISYAGVQIGLAFLLTVLQGFGPATDLAVASDRIIGILLGNIVIYFVFTLIWPVSSAKAVTDSLRHAADSLARLAALPAGQRTAATRTAADTRAALARADAALRLIAFEPAKLRPPATEQARLASEAAALDALTPRLFLGTASAEDRRRLAQLAPAA